jgi:hypothetical protein
MTILLTAAAILTGYLAAAVLTGRVLGRNDPADTEPDPRALPVIDAAPDAAAGVVTDELVRDIYAYLEDAP